MLTPEYLSDPTKTEKILQLYRDLETFIMKDIAGRLLTAGEMSGTADWMLYRLRAMGESQKEIQKRLMKMTGLSNVELKAILQDAVLTSWEDDYDIYQQMGVEILNPLENQEVLRIIDAEYRKSQSELSNLTRTTMNQSQVDLMNMLDEAEFRVSSGVQSYSAAVCDILDRYAGKGIYVYYPAGTRRTLEAAVRCCVVTSMNQTAAQMQNQYIMDTGVSYILTSAHLGARVRQKGQPPLAGHDTWQGRVFSIVGSEPGIPNLLESTGYDIDPQTGNGTVVNPLGLHGYNCRHGHKPWSKDLRNPYLDENGNLKIDTEENRKAYELSQKQRGMERKIRETRRRLMMKQQELDSIAETDVKEILQPEYDKLAYKLTQQNKAYNDFCKDNDLQPQYDRNAVSGWKAAQARQANAGAKRYKKAKEETP